MTQPVAQRMHGQDGAKVNTLTLEGDRVDLEETTLDVENLLLDPNNFRFQDEAGYVTADAARFHESSVQDRAYRRLRSEGLLELKNSIVTNGFLPVERLVVRPYAARRGFYTVVEGNRRLAALRWIKEDDEAGVSMPLHATEILHNVPVVVLSADADESIYLSLMGIRHVGGIRQWGGYQRAKLVTELRDRFEMDGTEIGARLGMSTQEVNRRYRAFKALGQMQFDPEYSDRASPNMYALFHEAVAVPVVRTWLGWNDESSEFADEDSLQQFYELIAPTEYEDGFPRSAKITTYSQVRQLKNILALPDAKRILLDPERPFDDALGVAKAEELSRSWTSQVAEAVSSLTAIGWKELSKLDSDDIEAIKRLRDVANDLIKAHAQLQQG
jgi:ParB-like nuclease family protein